MNGQISLILEVYTRKLFHHLQEICRILNIQIVQSSSSEEKAGVTIQIVCIPFSSHHFCSWPEGKERDKRRKMSHIALQSARQAGITIYYLQKSGKNSQSVFFAAHLLLTVKKYSFTEKQVENIWDNCLAGA